MWLIVQITVNVQNYEHDLQNLFTQEQTHTHTHPFSGPLSGTTRVSRYQKGKTNLDFTEARVAVASEWQWHQLPAPHHSVFYRPDALPAT